MRVTATEAKNRFGAVCAKAKTEPVFIEKDGNVDTVILSAATYEKLQACASSETVKDRKNDFSRRYAVWLKKQNARFEERGLWCDDLRVW